MAELAGFFLLLPLSKWSKPNLNRFTGSNFMLVFVLFFTRFWLFFNFKNSSGPIRTPRWDMFCQKWGVHLKLHENGRNKDKIDQKVYVLEFFWWWGGGSYFCLWMNCSSFLASGLNWPFFNKLFQIWVGHTLGGATPQKGLTNLDFELFSENID